MTVYKTQIEKLIKEIERDEDDIRFYVDKMENIQSDDNVGKIKYKVEKYSDALQRKMRLLELLLSKA